MSSILVNPKDEKELRLISDLLSKMGVENTVLTDTQKEDLGLSMMMKEADLSDVVNEDEIDYKLNS